MKSREPSQFQTVPRSDFHRVLLSHHTDVDGWLIAPNIAKLIGMYVWQWEHLNAFNEANDWMRSWPATPYSVRMKELDGLYEQISAMAAPGEAEAALVSDLTCTQNFAQAIMNAGDPTPKEETFEFRYFETFSAKAVQDWVVALEGTRDYLLDIEAQITGPVAPIPPASEIKAA